MLDRSPIEQALIDGVLYWDKIGENWHRLLHRTTQDVWGHYKFEYGWTPRWVGTTKAQWQWSAASPDVVREFKTAEEAREWIEITAATRLSTQEKSNG